MLILKEWDKKILQQPKLKREELMILWDKQLKLMLKHWSKRRRELVKKKNILRKLSLINRPEIKKNTRLSVKLKESKKRKKEKSKD
jgi:hypothetical protein